MVEGKRLKAEKPILTFSEERDSLCLSVLDNRIVIEFRLENEILKVWVSREESKEIGELREQTGRDDTPFSILRKE